MRPRPFASLFLAFFVSYTCYAQPQQQGPRLTVFVNVNVVPMDTERVLENHTVVVRGDRIMEVGPTSSVEIPDGAVRIDGAGKYLMPGLSEMHGHVPNVNFPGITQKQVDDILFLYVSAGITTVRGMLGAPGQLELRDQAGRGQIISPTLYLAGPSFSGGSIDSPNHARERVRHQKAEGWDLLKVHPGLTLEEYDAMAETAAQVGFRFGGHVPADVGILHAIKMGQETFDHIDGYLEYAADPETQEVDEAKLDEAIAMTKAAGAWVVPTAALWEHLLAVTPLEEVQGYPELKYMPPQTVQGWINGHRQRLQNPPAPPEVGRAVAAERIRILKKLHEAGAGILMGTDAPQIFSVPGFSLHREMKKMAEADMTPYEVLKTGSQNVGLYFQRYDSFGTIQPGRRADMILTNQNPLENLDHVADKAGVMVRGRWLSQEDIQRRLDEIAASNASSS